MPPKTVTRALLNMLEDLNDTQLNYFISAILDRREEPRVRRAFLVGKTCQEIADVLVSTYTESGAKDVALETLGVINCNAQRQSFAKDTELLTSVSNYGDIMIVETTGASTQTAQQDKLKYSGVNASHTMASTDTGRMQRYRSKINTVGGIYGIDPALIAAIISRESRAGNTLDNGWGDFHNAWGLMQVDVNPNGGGHIARGAWDSEEHLCQATEILVYFIGRIRHKFPHWSTEQQLKGGIAAYNMGDGSIDSYDNVDGCTTGGDYSNDVVARAQWYRNYGGF
ncbi:lysozyme g isoform X1 [Etheostoma spectabile]|uniref:lysozyme g isoform X1 n=1 Tax=Etheostoma spectabile TaxID=54343 RepID=UPI0013AFA75F|nr:lysozyme g-like isoform X1 [Etheostoma spectabile]